VRPRKRIRRPTRSSVKPGGVTSDGLYERIRSIWESARTQAARSVNSAHVCANWLIGQQIVEAEQHGAGRAGYGLNLLKSLSERLRAEYGQGFSETALKYMRLFYLAYPRFLRIRHTVRDELQGALKPPGGRIGHTPRDQSSKTTAAWQAGTLHPSLSWSHYRTLLRVERQDVRSFYEIEAVKKGWSARQLERQLNSLLFERLLKSRDKKGLMALANRGLVVQRPVDAIKDPYVLEFLNLPESERLVESRIETALLSKLQAFLLELGQGFAFVGRQQRLTLDGDHFYPDLVFYHIKLRCYVVIDLKVARLSHADLGQMQLYVNYYDQKIAGPEDNPTIGLILCTDKNDAMVRYVLGKNARQIFASRYKMHLPSEQELRDELRREMESLPSPER
jgi:predicted nuclease of restriction endonuclease-like (RecB) superfamily